MITSEQIDTIIKKHSSKVGFRDRPVRNFLGSLDGEYRDAVANMIMDTNMYKWKGPIVTAIREGINIHFGRR